MTESRRSQAAAPAGNAPVACFGERGMDHRPERAARAPIAAGLFGMASRTADAGAPIIVRGARIVPIA